MMNSIITVLLCFGFANGFSQRIILDSDLMNQDVELPKVEDMFGLPQTSQKRSVIPKGPQLFSRSDSKYNLGSPDQEVAVSKDGNIITISPQDGGAIKPRLYVALEKILSESEMNALKIIPGDFFQDLFNLVSIKITKDGDDYQIEIKGKAFTGIKYFELSLDDVDLDVEINNAGAAVTFTLAGKVTIGVAEAQFNVDGNNTDSSYSATLSQVSPVEFVDQIFGGDASVTDKLTSFVTDTNIRKMFEKKLPELKLVGVRTGTDEYQFILHTTHEFSDQGINLNVYCFISKVQRKSIDISFFAKVSGKVSLSKIVTSLTSLETFPEIRLFENIDVQAVASVSMREVALIANAGISEVLDGVFFNEFASTIPKGLAIHFAMNLKEKLQTCSGKQLPDFPDASSVSVVINQDGVKFFPPKERLPVDAIVTCLFQVGNDFFQSDLVSGGTGMTFNKIFYNRTDGGIEVDFEINKPLSWLSNDFVSVNSLKVQVKREAKGKPPTFNIEFNKTVDQSTYIGKIVKEENGYDVQLKASMLPVSKILSLLTFPTLTSMRNAFNSVVDFGIKDFLFEAKWNEESTFRVAGKPYIFGFDRISFEAVIWKKDNKRNVAFGLKFDQISLNEMIKAITKTDTTTGAWLSGIDIVVVVVSSKDGLDSSIDKIAEKKKSNSRKRNAVTPTRSMRRRRSIERYGSHERPSMHKKFNITHQKSHTLRSRLKHVGHQRWQTTLKPSVTPAPTRASHPQVAKEVIVKKDGEDSSGENDEEDSEEDEEEKQMKFVHDAMKDVEIENGLTVRAVFNIPSTQEGCKGDEVCNYIREKLAPAKLTITGKFQKKDAAYDITLSASLDANIALAEKLFFTNANIEIRIAGLDSSIQIQASLEYRMESKTIGFTGSIKANANQLKIEFTMNGLWEKPFNVQWLAFGNLAVSAVFEFKTPSLLFGFGGTLQLGKIGTADIIEIQIYLGFNVNLPTSSYIYGNISAVTIDKISKAFDVEISSSEAVKQTGFPEGLVFSYNGGTTEQVIEKFDITVKKGLYLKGKINILGYSIAGELELNDERLRIYLELDPIIIGSEFIRIQRSSDDSSNGPILDVDVARTGASRGVNVKIEGFIYTCGIGTDVEIQINNTHFHMHIEGKLFDVVTATLDIDASYGNSLEASQFTFRGCLSADLQKLREKLAAFLRNIQKKAEELVKRAEDVKKAIEAEKQRIQLRIDNRKKEALEKKKRADEELAALKRKAASRQLNCNEECPMGCTGFLVWKSRCFKIFWSWVGCLKWDSCAFQSRGVLCLAGCHIKNAANAVYSWGEQVGLKLKNAFSRFQDFIMNTIDGITKFAATLGQGIITVFQSVTNVVGQVAGMIADFVIESDDFLKINHVCLYGGAQAGKSACVGVDVDVVLFKYPIKFDKTFCIGSNFLDGVSQSTASKKYPEAEKIEEKSKEFDGEVKELDKKKGELQEKESDLDKEAGKTEDQVSKRFYIPERPDLHERKRTFKLDMVNSSLLSEFDRSGPLAAAFGYNEDNFITLDGDHETVQSFFNDKPERSECAQTRSVVGKYSEIANGAKFMADNILEQRHIFEKEKKLYQTQLAMLRNRVQDAENIQNISYAEKQEIKFWYQRAKSKIDYWIDDAETAMNQHHTTFMKTYKRQLDTMLHQHTKNDSIAYMRSLIEKGESLIRRSGIPGDEADKQSELLTTIHESLEDVLTNHNRPIPATKRSLDTISQHIVDLRSYHRNC